MLQSLPPIRLGARVCTPALRAMVLAAWTIVAAASAHGQAAVEGQWEGPLNWPYAVSHAALLSDGNVLVWNERGDVPQVWDPVGDTFTAVAAPDTFTTGTASLLLPDGDVVVLGGRLPSDSAATSVVRFDAVTSMWSVEPPMNTGRSGATAILMTDGRMLALSGRQFLSQAATISEIAEPGGGWLSLAQAPLALPDRPWTFALSDGQAWVVGPDQTTRSLDPSGGGDWDTIGSHMLGGRTGGTALLVPGATDRVLVIGGRDPATPTCEVLDVPNSTAWQATGALNMARRHHNATILADGSVLVTGGTLAGDDSTLSVLAAERYDTVSQTWSVLDSMSVSRRSGSVALLLPDARVLVAGGGDGTPGSELHADAEIFSPPYLFQGPRPTITAAVDSIAHGDTLAVTTPDADSIDAVWLVRAGSVHGAFNGDQRALTLAFSASSGALDAVMPDTTAIAPPGTYMLFLVDNGVPSIAHLLNLFEPPPVVPIPDITTTPLMSAEVGKVYSYGAQADGPGPITWSLEQSPSWLNVDSTSGVVSGVPDAEQVFLVTLRATNAGGFDEQTWNITATGTPRTIIPIGASWRYFKGTSDPGATWTNVGFPDSTWLVGPSGFGFGDGDDATLLDDMQGNYSTVYTRYTFEVFEPQSITRFSLLYDYDDGFAAYLNGTLILGENAPGTIVHTSTATSSREATGTLTQQEITDPATLALFQSGENVLAVVGLNVNVNNNDFSLLIELELTGGADAPTDVVEGVLPRLVLEPAFPNPFTHTARFRFALERPGPARLDVFDVRGRRIRTLVAPHLVRGAHVLEWDGRDARGQYVTPGVYFYRLRTLARDLRGKVVRATLR